MRIHRIVLDHFRGVDAAAIEFDDGVTVVEGPNEAGKSTIAEAISVLFDHRDSSRRQEVRAVHQIGADVGPYVEVDLTIGAYDINYSKRFLRRPSTSLRIGAPTPEQLTGREAHDRMTTILKETLDDALWGAMRVAQGASLDQPDLADVGVLRAALADGEPVGGSDGESDHDLIARVATEYARYFTPRTGQPTGELSAAVDAHESARVAHDGLTAELESVEAVVRRHEAIDAELGRLADEEADHAVRLTEVQRDDQALTGLRAAYDEAVAAVEVASGRLHDAGRAVAARTELIEELRERQATVTRLDTELAALGADVEALGRAADQARDAAHTARADVRAAEAAHRAATDAAHVIRLGREADDLDERVGRAERARDDALAAEAVLAGVQLDDAGFERLTGLDAAARAARELRRVGASTIEVEPIGATDVRVQGAEPDADGRRAVLEPTTVEVPGVVRVTVRPGRAEGDLADDVDRAEAALTAALDEAGVADVRDARDAVCRARDAGATREVARARVRDALGDADDLDSLVASASATRERHRDLLSRHEGDLPATSAAADAAADTARGASDEAARKADDLDRLAREHEAAVSAAREAHARCEQRRDGEHAEVERVGVRLDHARAETSDDALGAKVDEARTALDAAAHERDRAGAALDAAEPDDVAARLSNAEAVTRRLGRARRELEDERQQLTGRLDGFASRGLHDQHDAAAAAFEQTEGELARVERRADAARLLYDTLRQHRDTARRRYVAPYRAAIEALGRIVFGSDLSVEITDDLAIASRTLAGRTVAFDSLSGGAREQLAILGRLAVASLVDPVEGAPLILDDALGHADPERLDRIAAVLNRAGESHQIIVLTCHPERFRSVGSAATVRLGTLSA
ncbi:AAA family ATPase [Solicola gregarius]|uniref:AAA family ATPase n=1 Tax=Solicola gregarius TaxID=2908642 RepID=A0AA46TGL3_9ACTN|nr:AAA family ATPase [Solicola gregarius]UYM04746.1 AAA family ATPase [Solicola gregarius]